MSEAVGMREGDLASARILIVDDEQANVVLLERMLRQAGYATFATTTDPRRALPLFLEFQPDLVILDLHMRGVDGFEVMEQLRSCTPSPTYLPILVLSADTSPSAKQRAQALGAKNFLSKPLDYAEMALRTKKVLEVRALHLKLHEMSTTTLTENEHDALQAGLYVSERLETLAQLAFDIAHDLSNLMSVIRNYATFVVTGVDQQMETDGHTGWAQIRGDAEEIRLAAERSEVLAHKLLNFGCREAEQGLVR